MFVVEFTCGLPNGNSIGMMIFPWPSDLFNVDGRIVMSRMKPRFHWQRTRASAVAAVGVCLLLAAGWWQTLFVHRQIPTTHFSDVRPPVASDRCAACHSGQAESLRQAPHSVTLQPGSSEAVRTLFDRLEYRNPDVDSVTDRFEVRDQSLWRRSTALPDAVPIDWVFGSGRHARTPVTVFKEHDGGIEIVEHRLSFYPGIGLDLTLGNSDASLRRPGWHGVGNRLSSVDAADCFGCHSSWLPENQGHLDLSRIRAGVQCSRCHQEGEAHIDAANAGKTNLNHPLWSELSPLDSIRRCGECHRRDDQMTPFELRTTNPLLVRFAPAGLSQSRCFTRQDRLAPAASGAKLRLDCITCHDPHRPAETNPQYYVDRCLNCHNEQTRPAIVCLVESRPQNCLDCHMPRVEVQSHLSFTDHWIRRRPEQRAASTP
jgi:hypothetical protein